MIKLDQNQLTNLNNTLKDINEESLSMGVYAMEIVSITNTDKSTGEALRDRNGNMFLKIAIRTGFKKNDGGNRYFVESFHLEGTYPDGTAKIIALARFLKRCFKIKELNDENLNSIVGKKLAVATKKDKEGYISFWYAGHIGDLTNLQRLYKAKDESINFQNNSSQNENEDDLPF